MIEKGQSQKLQVHEEDSSGFYLRCTDGHQVFMPGSLSPEGLKSGDECEVFVYVDGAGHQLATPRIPPYSLGDLACLEVVSVTDFGAYVDMGLPKDLLVPTGLQEARMKVGGHYLIKILEDPETGQFCGTTRVDGYLAKAHEDLRIGERVEVVPYASTPLGYKVLVASAYRGMIYHNEIFIELEMGKSYKGRVKTLRRNDGRVDVILGETGGAATQEAVEVIMKALEESGGRLPLWDKSSPDAIRDRLGISKKSFKNALGALYKRRLVALEEGAISAK